MDIKVFDTSISLQGIVDSYTSFNFTSKYNQKGCFTIKAPFNNTNKQLLVMDNIICADDKVGIIENVRCTLGETNSIIISGSDITNILSRRIVWDTVDFTGTVEDFLRKLVNDNVVTGTDRQISIIELAARRGLTQTLSKQVSYKNLYEVINETALAFDLGVRMLFLPKQNKMQFDVYQGVQTDLVLSRSFDNVLTVDYIESKKDYATIAKVGGQGEGTARQFVTTGTGTGLNRYETFVDAKEIEITDSYTANLTQKGNEVLSQKYLVQSLTATVDKNICDLVSLGDKVKLLDKELNLMLDTRITEIQEIYESTGKTTNLTFGNAVPLIYK
ncbi:MAG: siphovirus ReqiPepy6 Gp37-like family protein [Oscillospiraceae bacterium]|nr:siphovirus ReqiPepy6 Gp37-like family protein [Oscillospiraceae bacterium]